VGLVWISGGGFCTGTLIAPDVVLTAGHCVADPVEGFYTGQGTPTANMGPEPVAGMIAHPADQTIAHPEYATGSGCPNSAHDIGLVHLASPITGIAPVPYATAGGPTVGSSCVAVGYGTHTASGTDTVEAKRSCTEIIQSTATTALQVTVGTGLADHGDSGGPLICNNVIAGATSCHTDGDWPGHHIEYYARIDNASDWIAQTIAAWEGAAPDSGAVSANACAHALCKTGAQLVATCDACATQVCASDAYCCSTTWDNTCVNEAVSICHVTCP
jgi:hypothetical protein